MEDLYAEIREQHKRDYGSKFEEWAPRILVDQYSDRTHFIFELIQNAEDAGATYVTFTLYPDRLVLCHNGIPFTEADIRGICGIRSTKDEPESGKIGRFGIGFKSVYAYTKTPEIRSGMYAFKICNLILPYAENVESTGEDTILTIPFDGNVGKETAYGEIKNALEEFISLDVLFALQNIRNISCEIQTVGEKWTVSKEIHTIGESVDRVMLSQQDRKKTKELLVFHTQNKQPVQIGYELQRGDDGREKIVPAMQHYLYVYFPTAVETHQAFYIHVPFSTTPARDNVRHNEVNRLLAERLNELFAKSVRWLLENGYVTLKFLNDVYPLTDTCKEENLQGIHHMGRKLFQEGVKILPTDAGGYCAVNDAMLPYAKNIAENITQEILKKEYGKEICWVQADICLSAYVRLWVYLVQSFGIKVLRWKDVLPKLTTDILEEQPDEWLLNLMEVINSTCTGNMRSKEKVDARSIPFVRLQDGTQICARYDGVAQVYLNNPISCKNKIKNTILKDRRGYDFYVAALDIEEYNAVQELKDDVICFYGDNSEDTDIPFEDNLEHFLVIERALKENDNDVRRILKNIPIVFDYNGEWKKPDECYLTNKMIDRPQYESRLLSRLDIQWISDKYIEYITPDVFQKIGCNTTLKSIQVDKKSYLLRLSLHDKELYAQAIEKIFSKLYTEVLEPETWNWAFSVEHIKDLVTEVSLSESIDIVDFLNEIVGKHPLYGKMRGARDRNYSGKSVATLEKIPSALAIELESENWLYDKDGRLKPITELKASDLNADYDGHGEKLFSQLPFIPENEAVEAAIQTVDAPYQDFVSTMLKKPDELRWMFEAYQKFQRKKRREETAPESLLGLLEKQSSARTEIESERTLDEDELGEYGAVQNLKHREKKLDESFQEGLEGQKAVTPKLRYTCSESNQEEKAFLKAQYFGKCQICGKQILQANGKVYFEACNILPTDVVPARYKQSISEGWNSLCLCPNCAAEFKFGKKNLSGLISMIQNYHVEERDENLIVCDIEMQGEKRSIKYTGKHFLALQRAVSFYEADMNSSTK